MHRLITIPFSHFCEKARWGLERAGVAFREEGHPPMLHWAHTLFAGAGRTVPVLVVEGGPVLGDSSAILEWADGQQPGSLYPQTRDARRETMALEDEYDRRLGPHTRRLAYYHMLMRKDATLEFMTGGVPGLEASMLRAIFPGVRAFMRRAMRIDKEGAARSLGAIERVFADADARLERSPCLVGDSVTAADLTFASLSAPLLVPPGYPTRLPDVDALPPAYGAVSRRFRQTRAGAHALLLYARERGAAPARVAGVGNRPPDR
jgi:glutathione S-transferase